MRKRICLLSLLAITACQMERESNDDGDAIASPAGQPQAALAARADLASRLDISTDQVEILEARSVYWRSAALGCPQPGYSYAQVLTPGWFIRLAVGRSEYRYHAGEKGAPFTCDPRRAEPPQDYAID